MTQELLEMIAQDPRAFLRRNRRTQDRINIKRRRLEELARVSVSITQAVKPVVVYTGPGDKIGECAIEMADLRDELLDEIAELENIQRETGEAIRLLLKDETLKALLEAYYLAGMSWEEIAYTMHYAYRWVMRLHKKALKIMQDEAKALTQSVQND